jgi:hypothetical protein
LDTLLLLFNGGPSINIDANTYNNGYSTPNLHNINEGNWAYDIDIFKLNVSVMRVNMGAVKDFLNHKRTIALNRC